MLNLKSSKFCFSSDFPRTIEQSVATADDKFAIFKNYTRKENLTHAQQFCDESLHGNLTRIIELKFTGNATLPASTGWIGLALSNSTFLWYNNKTALDILQCLPRPNTNEKFCTFYEYMNQNTGALPLSSVGLACSACKNITATFFACVKGNNVPLFINSFFLDYTGYTVH